MLKIVFFQAHPDDLEFYCFHLIKYLSQLKNKYEISIASMTRGEYGTPLHGYDQFKGERLGKLRTNELYNAIKYYGFTPDKVQFFGFIDGEVKFNKPTIERVRKFLEIKKPDLIFAPEPIYTIYQHPDHLNTGKILYFIYDKIFTNEETKLYFYTPLNSNFRWPFKREHLMEGLAAINEHKSQRWMIKYLEPIYKLMVRNFGRHIKGWKYAEGFRRVYYRDNAYKNKKLSYHQYIFLILSIKMWPKSITEH